MIIWIFQHDSSNFALTKKHQHATVQGFWIYVGILNTTTMSNESLQILRQQVDFWSWP